MKRDKEGCNYRNGKCCYHCQFFLVPSSEVLSKMNVFLLMLGAFTDVAIVTPPFLSMSRSRRRPARAFNGLAVPRYTPNRSRCARSGVHARDSWICCYETDKKGCRSATPADGILAAHCRPNGNSAFPFKGQLTPSLHYSSLRGKNKNANPL